MPKLRFKDVHGRDFPEWENKQLGDIVEVMQSGVSRMLSDSDIGLPVIRSNNLVNNKLDVSDIKYWHLKDDQGVNLENYFLKEGDLLVNFINSLAQIGKVALFENTLNRDTIFTTNLMRLSFKRNANTKYISCFFQTNEYIKHIQAITKPAVNQASFTTKEFKTLIIPFPCTVEQTKVANFLTAVDEKISQLTQKSDLLAKYKKGVMQKIFSQELRFKDGDGRDFPEWKAVQFGEIFTFKTTNSYSRECLNYVSGTVKNIHYGDIHTKFKSRFKINNERVPFINENIDLTKLNPDCFCVEGDLVIADASEDYKDIGKCIEIDNLDNQTVIAGLHTFLARPSSGVLSRGFMSHAMQSDKIRLQIMTIAQGTKVLSITTGRLSKIGIPLPEKEEQTKIANFLTAIDDKITQTQAELDAVKQYKQGLLQQMFV